MKIKIGDNVKVLTGKDKGATGKVTATLRDENAVVVSGVNKRKKHQRSRGSGKTGQVIEKEMPIHISNVAILDPKQNVPTRIGYQFEQGKKVRIAKKSGSKI